MSKKKFSCLNIFLVKNVRNLRGPSRKNKYFTKLEFFCAPFCKESRQHEIRSKKLYGVQVLL